MNSARRHRLCAFVLASSAAAAACGLGDPGEPSLAETLPPVVVVKGTSGKPEVAKDCVEPACESFVLPASTHVARLTHAQWERTMRDLLRLDAAPGTSSSFPSDPVPTEDHFLLEASKLFVTSPIWKGYRDGAEALSALVTGTPARLEKILPPAIRGNAGGDMATRIAAFVADFLPRAYRRPATAAEIATVIAVGEQAAQSLGTSDPFTLRIHWILRAVLQSPKLLYRAALGEEGPAVNGRARLGAYDVATKLSYSIWGTMPDETLLGHAKSGKLATSAGVAAVAKEMLADPRAEVSLADFHDRFFLADRYTEVNADPLHPERSATNFPDVYEGFFADAKEDVRRTVHDLVIAHPGGVKDLHTSDVAYVNAKLAPIYGIAPTAVSPTGFTRIQMNRAERVGVLMHPGWLAYKGTPKDPATILRGVFMARRILCLQLGSPPAAANAANVNPANISQPTNRERVAETTKTCGDGCHGGAAGVINPLGFPFEDFDSIGKHRATELTPLGTRVPVNTKTQVPQLGSFTGGAALFQSLAEDARAHACYAAHWSAYLNDSARVDVTPRYLSPALSLSLKGASVREIITELVQTDAFLTVSR